MNLTDMTERELRRLADLLWDLIVDEGDLKMSQVHERIMKLLEDAALLKR